MNNSTFKTSDNFKRTFYVKPRANTFTKQLLHNEEIGDFQNSYFSGADCLHLVFFFVLFFCFFNFQSFKAQFLYANENILIFLHPNIVNEKQIFRKKGILRLACGRQTLYGAYILTVSRLSFLF